MADNLLGFGFYLFLFVIIFMALKRGFKEEKWKQ